MWRCNKCSEKMGDEFEVCWNCGTTRDGVEDPNFRNAEDIPADEVVKSATIITEPATDMETAIRTGPANTTSDRGGLSSSVSQAVGIVQSIMGLIIGAIVGTFVGIVAACAYAEWTQSHDPQAANAILIGIVTVPSGCAIGATLGGIFAAIHGRKK
jgi:hypothetical protein